MESDPGIRTVESPEKTSLIWFKFFWTGLLIYVASYSISATGQVSYVLCNLFQVLGLILLFSSAAFLVQFKLEDKFLKLILFVYFSWSFVVIVRGIEFNYLFIKQMLFDPSLGILPYLVPIVIFFPKEPKNFKGLFDLTIIFCFIFFIYDALFIRQLLYPTNDTQSQSIIEEFTQQLSFPCGFLLLTFLYHPRKRNLLVLMTLVITFILVIIRARRGLIFMVFNMLIFSYMIYQYVNKRNAINIVFSFFIISFVVFAGVKVYNENRKDTFALITERFSQDTRSGVEEYFFQDLKTNDWIFGKGLNGQYYCPGVREGIGHTSIYRKVIETGFLQIILNSGILGLALLLIIAIIAIIKGIFYSKNILAKASGIWIFIFLLFMYPGTPTVFSLYYILIWISIGICYSRKMRNMEDNDIKEAIYGGKIKK